MRYAAPPSEDSFVYWLACEEGKAFFGEYVQISGGDRNAAAEIVQAAAAKNLVAVDLDNSTSLMELTAAGYARWGALSKTIQPAVYSTLTNLWHGGGVKPIWLMEQHSGGSTLWQQAVHEAIRGGYATVIVAEGSEAIALTPSGAKLARSIVERARRGPHRGLA